MPEEWTGIIAIEGEPTGDGRMIETGALHWDDGPWPLIWDREDGDHTGVTVGSVTTIWRDGSLIRGSGFWSDSDDSEAAADVLRARELVTEGAVGVSIAFDSETVELRARLAPEGGETEMPPGLIGDLFLSPSSTDRPWSAAAARNRVFDWATDEDGVLDLWQVSRAFLYRDPDSDPASKTAYRFGIADVVNGTLRLVPRAVTAAAKAIASTDLALRPELERMVCGLYARLDTFGICPFADSREVVGTWVHDDALTVVTDGRVRHLAIVDTPAFADARIAPIALGLVAAGAGVEVAFVNPTFGTSTYDDPRLVAQSPERPGEAVAYGCPLTIDEPLVYGHALLWGRCHSSFKNQCVIPPRGGDYSRFLHGEAAPGIRTGVLTVGTTHASLAASAQAAMDHYSNTGRAVADVTIGEDMHGLWVSGRLRPGISDRDLADLRGSSLSGDWRPSNGKYRLVGLLAVNSPGYLVQRPALVASDGVITAGPCSCESDYADGDMPEVSGDENLMFFIADLVDRVNTLQAKVDKFDRLEELVTLDVESRKQLTNTFAYASGGASGNVGYGSNYGGAGGPVDHHLGQGGNGGGTPPEGQRVTT